jgi:hypothetical protein
MLDSRIRENHRRYSQYEADSAIHWQSTGSNSRNRRNNSPLCVAIVIRKPKVDELAILNQAAQALAQCSDLKEVKSIRDKAEAVRKYAQNAALGLQIQNQAAELKLRAERRAGELLASLKLRGGNRKSNSHDDSLKLTDLGIDHNQSARWQREAAVPESVFTQYVSNANQLAHDITTQGLLRLARNLNGHRNYGQQPASGCVNSDCQSVRPHVAKAVCPSHSAFMRQDDEVETPDELIREIINHRLLLEQVLRPYCESEVELLRPSEKRLLMRLLAEFKTLLASLQIAVQP